MGTQAPAAVGGSTGPLGSGQESNIDDDVRTLGTTSDEPKVDGPKKEDADNVIPPFPAEKDEEEEEKVDEEEEEEEKEEKEEEKEEEEEEEEQEEDLDKLAGRKTTFRDIKKEYPELFKKFPDLRDAFFRNEKFSEIFPTPEDAAAVVNSMQGFNFLEQTLNQGNPEVLFRVLDKQPLKEVAQRFLPTLLKVDREAFDVTMDGILRNVIRDIAGTAQQSQDQNLLNAAKLLSKHFYNTYEIPQAPKPAEPRRVDPERLKFEQEKQAFMAERRDTFAQDTFKTGTRLLSREVAKGLDPEATISPYMRDALISKIVDEVGDKLESDPQHMRTINSIWAQAERAGYVGDWKTKIIRAYLGRARQLLPAIRQKVRSEFVERKAVSGKVNTGKRFQPSARNSPAPNANAPVDPKKIDWDKSSDLDVLMGKAVVKK
jgi:hypothetical protein